MDLFEEWPCAAGDEVWVFGGRSFSLAKVEKIGSKLIHVKEGWRTTAYKKDTYQRNDGGPGGGMQTQPQRASLLRRDAVTKALRDTFGVGVEWQRVSEWTTHNLEQLFDACGRITGKIEEWH